MKNILFISFLISATCLVRAQENYEAYYRYLGNYPSNRETGWNDNVQGIAHDHTNWFITQTEYLWKIPVIHDLDTKVFPCINGVKKIGLGKIPCDPDDPTSALKVAINDRLVSDGYDHFGDPEWYEFDGKGYLLVPMEGSREVGAIAIFRADDLQYFDHDYLFDQDGVAQRKAGWCAVDRQGNVYSSTNVDVTSIHKYRVEWDSFKDKKELKIKKGTTIELIDQSGSPITPLQHMQGGVISPSGELLYLVAGFHDKNRSTDGIHVFDLATGQRLQQSTNGSGLFNYEFHPGKPKGEEPEGITTWDLTGRGVPGINGELHVLMLNNDWPGFIDDDNVYLKHYTAMIFVDHSYNDDDKEGTHSKPFKTVGEANNLAWDGAQIIIAKGSYAEKLTISKRVRILADKGPVIIGQ